MPEFVGRHWPLPACGAGLFLLLSGLGHLRRARIVRQLPTSRVRSVAMGLAELTGTARPAETPMVSPVRKLPCAWWRVEVRRYLKDGQGRERVQVLLNRAVGVPFTLDDGTGAIRVEPDGAEITGVNVCRVRIHAGDDPEFTIRRFAQTHGFWSTSLDISYGIEEWALLLDAPVYVLGRVESFGGQAEKRRLRVAEILKGWLGDPARRAALDLNRDGILQDDEWEAARSAAQSQVLGEAPAAGAPALAVRRPRGAPFLVCSGTEADVLKPLGRPAWRLGLGLPLFVAGLARWLAVGP